MTPRYPGAYWRPTGSGNGKMPNGPDACSFHEAVTRAESVFGWVQTAHSCQAFIGQHGTSEQFAEWGDWMYGVSDGNSHVITIESFDGLLIQSNPYREIGMGGVYGDSANTGRWDDGQLERFADVSAFLHLEVGIPIVASPRAGDPGFGPHRLGVEPWRSDIYGHGERWTAHDGKPCPGDLRIKQIPGILARARAIADAVSAGRCGYLPTGPVDLTSALARTGTKPPPPPPEEGFLMSLSDADQNEVRDNLRWLRRQLEGGTAPGQVSIGSTIGALLPQMQAVGNKADVIKNQIDVLTNTANKIVTTTTSTAKVVSASRPSPA